MNNATITPTKKIKKLYVETTALFAINNIPGIDVDTLEKLLELVNATGNFGTISEDQLIEKMRLILKHIPGACSYSLITLAELLDVRFPKQVVDNELPAALIIPASQAAFSSSRWQ